MHRAAGGEHIAQRGEPRIRIGEVMKNPGAHDQVEARRQFVCARDRQLVHLEIGQTVRTAELLGAANAREADVNAGHLRVRPAQRILRRL